MALAVVDTAPIPAGALLTHLTEAITGGTLHVVYARNPDGTNQVVGCTFVPTTSAVVAVQLSTALNATTGSLPAGAITGASNVFLISSNAVPGAQLVRTAAQMLADTPGAGIGYSWKFRIINTGAGTLTLTADSGATVTLSGTMTVAQNTWRDFVGTFNTATTATITEVGVGTNS